MTKACACGRIHREIPSGATTFESGDELAGTYWNCACGSTLFLPKRRSCWILHRWEYSPDQNFRGCRRCKVIYVRDDWRRSGWAMFTEAANAGVLFEGRV